MVVGFFVILVVGALVADHLGKLPTIDELHEQDQQRWARMNPTNIDLRWEQRMDDLEQRKREKREHNKS